jgi:putative DNA methylase
MLLTTARSNGKTKKERLAQEIAKAVGAARPVAVETVDFNDPNRPKTCLEVDFPILPINQISQIEGNAGKPIYQMSKWWARRRSSVFRAMLLAGAMKAPEDPAQAAKLVWDVYYANHQKKGALKDIKVADIFMGGGTTIVEGSRLGMQMYGCDLNPVAWFIVKNEMAKVDPAEVQALLAEIEAEVKPQIMPFYACDCARGHKGKWTRISTGEVMGSRFDPLAVGPHDRKDYRYEGPEVIYIFWAKHGPCQMTGCGHRTPIMSSPVVAVKTMTVKAWEDFQCEACGEVFDVEASDARMAPGVPFVPAESEKHYTILQADTSVKCPQCGNLHRFPDLEGKGTNKKVSLTLLIHPEWLAGSPSNDSSGSEFGGTATDDAASTEAWNRERMRNLGLVEVRGDLPEFVTCPESGAVIDTSKGTVPKKSRFACGACGTVQDVLDSIKTTKKTGPVAAYAIQGYCPKCDIDGQPYNGRFFAPLLETRTCGSAHGEWDLRKNSDLKAYWPTSELPYGFMTHMNNGGIPNHGYTHWWKMFSQRQLLVHALLLRAVYNRGSHTSDVRDYVLGAIQQYLRNQNMFCIWDVDYDKLVPMLSNANFHPKACVVENSVFPSLGRGNWRSCGESLAETSDWATNPWELVDKRMISDVIVAVGGTSATGKSEKVKCGDPVQNSYRLDCQSATDLDGVPAGSMDLVVTDPPFEGLLHYSEVADFFHVWLRLVLKQRYPDQFEPDYTPKTLEVVANRARQPDDPTGFYKRLMTECWSESKRILKPTGLLAFTFHHSEDEPWVRILESLFDAGFYLEATYPIRSDETKGEGAKPGTFGSQTIEYDVIHVCRKRTEEPRPVSWARMRREVIAEVKQLTEVLTLHQKAGLGGGDLKVIKRGKALEYFSRHYGKVFVDEGKEFSVRDALIGINQLLDEESGGGKEPPPVNAEPFTRQFLRLFDGTSQQPREQMQMLLRGTTIDPKEYEERGWCMVTQKVYHLVSPFEIAQEWYGKHRSRLTSDYDQAMVVIGASFPNSGINVTDTLNNPNFRPHPALSRLLKWHTAHGATKQIRDAAIIAVQLYATWESQHQDLTQQLKLFFDDGVEG